MARPLKHWLYKHRDNPYPTKTEKVLLALGSQMTLVQVRRAEQKKKKGSAGEMKEESPQRLRVEAESCPLTCVASVQVSNWFANARRRLKNTVRQPDLSWALRIKLYNKYIQGNAERLSVCSDDTDSEGEGFAVSLYCI